MQEKELNRIKILDIPIDPVGYIEVLERIGKMIRYGGTHQIATVNPEFIMHSVRDSDFRDALVSSDLNTADGIGIVWASKFLAKCANSKERVKRYGKHASYIYKVRKLFWLKITLLAIIFNRKWLSTEIPERVTGSDLIWKIVEKAEEKGWSIYLLGGVEGVAAKVASKLKSKYPKIKIVGTYAGKPEEEGIVARVARIKPDILFVAYGSPKQERFIHYNLENLGSKVVIGVGGTFDFIIGKAKRAPKIMRKLGLEWLWRLLTQPHRAGRIWNAFPRFVKAVWKSM